MQSRLSEALGEKRLEFKYAVLGGLLILLLAGFSSSRAMAPLETDLMRALEAAAGIGLVGMFAIALISNLAVIVNIPFMVVALPWVLADPTPGGVLAFSLATGIGAGLGKLAAYALAVRVAARIPSLGDSPLHAWISAQMTRRPRFAPLMIFIAAGTVIPLDPALMPLLLVGYPARKVAAPLLLGKIVLSLTMALTLLAVAQSFGVGGSMNVDLTFGVVLGTVLLVGYQVEKARQAQAPTLVPVHAN